ncbi:MAG TPA: DivIVA domain-containing protein [Syntrophobacteraceae bacterium]|nr:DivIVA domain-containing protein [Syntrophobacteraceae bacterium]
MNLTSVEIQNKSFRVRWPGLDRKAVERFCQELTDEIQSLKAENSDLRKDLQEHEKELREHKEREKTIRAVLLNAQRTAEQTKANAEKEARLIVAEAELQAEKLLQAAQQRLSRAQDDITELKRHRMQLESRLRATVETYRNLLNIDKEDEEENEPAAKVEPVSG